MIRRPPRSPLFPSPPLFRSQLVRGPPRWPGQRIIQVPPRGQPVENARHVQHVPVPTVPASIADHLDRKSTRLNSSHANISYAVFCLKKKKIKTPVFDEYTIV